MARFDVYRNPDGTGYLLDVQANLLSHLNTRTVVPLLPPHEAPRPAQHLNPRFRVGTDELIMVTQFIAAVPSSMLKSPAGTLSDHHGTIVGALDFLMQGF
ncbi:MAG: ccdB [Rhodospirillales bacterium]|jgi:toxin CcdB|nr:ccdB [Rhodospirillales bacterium]